MVVGTGRWSAGEVPRVLGRVRRRGRVERTGRVDVNKVSEVC
jgi:hypothetical protein